MQFTFPERIQRIEEGAIFYLSHWTNTYESTIGYYYYGSEKSPYEELSIGRVMFEIETGIYKEYNG